MKIRKLKGALGIGLTVGVVFAMIGVVLAAPAAADLTKWTTVNTPSWADKVIEPGSDIFDYAVGPDGDTIYAIGAINTLDQPGDSITGISGSFDILSGTVTITEVSSSVATVSGTLYGDACYLNGDFIVVAGDDQGTSWSGGINIDGWVAAGGDAVLTGYIDGDPDEGDTTDTMTFSGTIYGTITGSGTETTSAIAPATICVDDEFFGAVDSGVVHFEADSNLYAEPRVWKSTDGGVTWDDITGTVQGATNMPGPFTALTNYSAVSVAPDDEEWVVIAGQMYNRNLNKGSGPGNVGYDSPGMVASKDGGDNFSYAGDMVDTAHSTWMGTIFDMDLAPETDSIHNVAIGGEIVNGGWHGGVFRLEAGTWLTGGWDDTTFYAGWDSGVVGMTYGVNTVVFSPNFDLDDTIVCLGVNDQTNGNPYLQSGIWETGGTWNDSAAFPKALEITSDSQKLLLCTEAGNMGLALPADYDGSDPGARVVFLFVDAYNDTTHLVGGYVFRVDNNALSPVCGPSGDPLLASIDVHGDADTGKLMIGEYTQWDNDDDWAVPFECCDGVRVWHTEELDFCCPQWDIACKNPSGPYMALVMYTPDGDKAYAATRGTVPAARGTYRWDPSGEHLGGLSDESAFSVSRDDGVSFNQLGLIDTDIDYLSDVAVCPDCGTIYLSTINISDCITCTDCDPDKELCEVCDPACDSVWRSYDDGDTWERVNHGNWSEDPDNALLLRLPCDAIEDCCDQDAVTPSGTIYLAVQGTKDMFYSRDCGQCWNTPPATKIVIQDFAVESENIVYVLDTAGYVSKSTQYGRRWSDKVDTGVESGHTIAACCEEGFVVVGGDGGGVAPTKVGWSDDGGDTWTLTDALPKSPTMADGQVHVACDPVCENIIYAAVDGLGIFRSDITDGEWTDLTALPYDYTGIVMAREGTLYASTDEISVDTNATATKVLMTDCFGRRLVAPCDAEAFYSGVARNLDPCETACCGTEDWDYLFCGLNAGTSHYLPGEDFEAQPSALRICGCLSIDTNSVLWAIDTDAYDVQNGSASLPDYGQLWSYEDCAAKMGPTLTSPADGAVIDCEPCAGCDASNFTLKWERMCNACSYDIQIMDENANIIVEWVDETITGDPPSLFVDGTMDTTGYVLECGETFTWKVREADTDCECIHSPWSEIWTFTVAVGAADAIDLLSPTKGALDVPIQNIGFSWTSVRNASSYSFVLSPNANLTGALVSQDMSTTAFNYVGPLDYNKAYYWQIIAWEDGTRLTTSSIGVFSTMAEPVAPTPPVVVEQTPAPVINIPPAEKITPTWIYAIIGIGAALAVVVIVLIVRTRRP
jgi:hypothetical protein